MGGSEREKKQFPKFAAPKHALKITFLTISHCTQQQQKKQLIKLTDVKKRIAFDHHHHHHRQQQQRTETAATAAAAAAAIAAASHHQQTVERVIKKPTFAKKNYFELLILRMVYGVIAPSVAYQ